MLLGLIREPDEGHLAEDLEAALELAVLQGSILPASKYIPPPQDAVVDSWL